MWNVKHKTKHLVLRQAGWTASEVVTKLAWKKKKKKKKKKKYNATWPQSH